MQLPQTIRFFSLLYYLWWCQYQPSRKCYCKYVFLKYTFNSWKQSTAESVSLNIGTVLASTFIIVKAPLWNNFGIYFTYIVRKIHDTIESYSRALANGCSWWYMNFFANINYSNFQNSFEFKESKQF